VAGSLQPLAVLLGGSHAVSSKSCAKTRIVVAVGQKMWRRSGGAILWLRSNLFVRVEQYAVREYKARQKTAKDRKGRALVRQFYTKLPAELFYGQFRID
jgi:hypothetical protein